ncbi:hypothetical protein [Kordiimonas aestuarii]|uniref:hypothetical protein n=1 Tax=Kordiimonas aestuarii TaxID=1005925 RepID=UPI0021CF0C54|nr:hypothetical protein [Kordiimonas aestuarii]
MNKKRLKFLLRWIALPLSIFFLVLGAITLPLPLPTGALLIGLGLAVAAFNPLMLRFIKRTRSRYPRANARIRAITPRLPLFLRRILTRTDNHRDKRVL